MSFSKPITTNALLIIAGYNGNGQMLSACVKELTAGSSTLQVFDDVAPAYTYKTFLLNRNPSGDPSASASCAPASAAKSTVNHSSVVKMQGRVHVPTVGGEVAHATTMAVDAYVEATAAKDDALSLFANTSQWVSEDGKYVRVNRLADIAKNGTDEEKAAALAAVESALAAQEHAVRAAAVLDAAAEEDLSAARASIETDIRYLFFGNSKQAEAEKWAQDLYDKWDKLPKKERLKNFAEQMGVDARTAHKALSDAHDILNGKYMGDSKFYDICTKVAMGVKTGAKVGVFVCATVATAGAAAAATGTTIMTTSVTAGQAAGILVGTVDCTVEVGRTTAKIVLGDDHKVVQEIENSTAMKVYDTSMFLYSAATFNPDSAYMGEKLLFIEDLVEKNIDAYTNVKTVMDETGDLAVDVIRLETNKAEFGSKANDALKKTALSLLDASETGIIGEDPNLSDGTAKEQTQSYTAGVDSSESELNKTYDAVGGGSKSFTEKVTEFRNSCDENVTYQKIGEGGGAGGGGGTGGGGGSGGEGGSYGGGSGGEGGYSGGFNFPTPNYDFDEVETKFPDPEWYDPTATYEYKYKKDGKYVGYVYYQMDENMRYWPTEERWLCGENDWLVTTYFRKGTEVWFTDAGGYECVTAATGGIIHERYVQHRENSTWYNYWYDHVRYWPNGQLRLVELAQNNSPMGRYKYAPDGGCWSIDKDWNTEREFYNYSIVRHAAGPNAGKIYYKFENFLHYYYNYDGGYSVSVYDGQGNLVDSYP